MKTSIILTLLAAMVFSSCKKDNVVAVIKSDAGAPVLSAPASNTAIVVTAPDTVKKFNIKWSKADYGVKTVVSYFVQMDAAGKNFATAINVGSTNADSLSFSWGSLNNRILNQLKLPANAASQIEFRIGAYLGKRDTLFSQTVKVEVTTYKEQAPEKLWVPGAYQGWSPGAAPVVRLLGDAKYEGYVYMNVADQFKFTSAADWVHVNYGYAGTAGKLTTDGLAGGVTVASAGYYKLNVDTKNLSYSAVQIQSFGLIGSATSGAWDNSTPMTYDAVNDIWKATANLVAGALKFRANNNWDINYGPADSNSFNGTLIQTDGAITINENGSYTVTIDLKQSTDKKYFYTVVKN
jgi:starch-binding outer membrane protein SusE/F